MADLTPPWALLAEVTHACPLHCPYCSNPLELTRRSAELSAGEWDRVFAEAAGLGVVQAHISGGEPLLRRDLDRIVAAACAAGIYTQLVTSGLGLTDRRLAGLGGLNSVQLSVQDARAANSDHIAGTRSFAAKRKAAAVIRRSGLPFGLNVVLHRHNLDHVDELIDLALTWGAERLELANTQFYGWALRNRSALLPTRDQLAAAEQTIARRRAELDIVWVLPDYFTGAPKPCMGGWATRSLTVTPDGAVLPCPTARAVSGRPVPTVREHSLEWIWRESPLFTAYRGTDWMTGPCRECPKRHEDFGGCRCQAFELTGDATRTDPACTLSPDHGLIQTALETPPAGLVYRGAASRSRVASRLQESVHDGQGGGRHEPGEPGQPQPGNGQQGAARGHQNEDRDQQEGHDGALHVLVVDDDGHAASPGHPVLR